MDKLHFILNNVSKTNTESKAKELRAVLLPEHVPYFAHYMVVKRISVENNLHKLYMSLLEAMKSDELRDQLIDQTYQNIQYHLATDKILTSMSERTLLKNLGSWLGKLTIGRNKPVLARLLDLKELVLDAYDRGRLIAVIPFVAKILENCSKSRVFKLPNPWLTVMLGMLCTLCAE